jgi:hypothetical protein
VLDGLTVGHARDRKRKSPASPHRRRPVTEPSKPISVGSGQWRGGGLKRCSLVNCAKSPRATKPRERNLL